jgi:hypothetical protein
MAAHLTTIQPIGSLASACSTDMQKRATSILPAGAKVARGLFACSAKVLYVKQGTSLERFFASPRHCF